jgi:hypothetical protein
VGRSTIHCLRFKGLSAEGTLGRKVDRYQGIVKLKPEWERRAKRAELKSQMTKLQERRAYRHREHVKMI